jgi:Zn-dependent M28 family amino/carboxypeptidase
MKTMNELDILTYFLENKYQPRRDILKNLLALCDIAYEVQPFEDGFYHGENIIVSLTNSKTYTLLVGHYDIFGDSLGINDNTTSIASLISMIIQIKDSNIPIKPIKILFSDLEEKGMRGSAHYAKMHRADIKEAIVLDIVGYGDMFIYGSHQQFNLGIAPKMKEVNMVLPSDNFAFEKKGIKNVLITAIHENHTKHVSKNLVQITDFSFSESFHNGPKDNDLSQINLELLSSLKEYLISYLHIDIQKATKEIETSDHTML